MNLNLISNKKRSFSFSRYSLNKNIKTNIYCLGGHLCSCTINREGNVIKTGRNLLTGKIFKCNGKKLMFVNEITKQEGGLNNFSKNLGKSSAKVVKKLATIVLKNPA